MNLTSLSNADLVALFMDEWKGHQQGIARLVAQLAEMESRNVHLEAACASLFE